MSIKVPINDITYKEMINTGCLKRCANSNNKNIYAVCIYMYIYEFFFFFFLTDELHFQKQAM